MPHPLCAACCQAERPQPLLFDGWYYLVAIRIDLPAVDDRGELTFAYARTRDFCTWEELAAPLRHGAPGDADESYIWAPHVVLVGETFYMYYTGVNRNIAQSIMLATSTNPADPQSWTKQGVVFRPQHPDAVYPGPTHWADCRDPMVLAYNGRYYLYYTGVNRHGPIIGVAVADAPTGPWRDLGAVYQSAAGAVPESPYVIEQAGVYYLFYNEGGTAGSGPQWRWSVSPFGPWQPAVRVGVGWAHDFYQHDGAWLVAYLVGNGAAIYAEPLRWHTSPDPAAPRIGERVYLPLVR
ncbi:MAG: family 43 glycosylhydrolase [Blastochloris sp.]|nr:family 43 glycosylhydrolase [Blastochloris sp.]